MRIGVRVAKPVRDLREIKCGLKRRADNLSTIIVSQRPCADWYEWLGGKYIADGVADRIINFYYLIELKGESRRALARKQAKEAAGL